LRSLGFKGGLKGCEQMGLPSDWKTDGYFAVLLWQIVSVAGMEGALETSSVNIRCGQSRIAAEEAYNLKLKVTPFRLSRFLRCLAWTCRLTLTRADR
jgi:hypothetical protein